MNHGTDSVTCLTPHMPKKEKKKNKNKNTETIGSILCSLGMLCRFSEQLHNMS